MQTNEYPQTQSSTGNRNRLFIILFTAAAVISVCAMIVYFGFISYFDRGVTMGDAVAVVDIQGEIFYDRWKLREIESHRENDNVKAVVLFINSPGGGVAASQALHRAVLDLRLEKPFYMMVIEEFAIVMQP